MTVMNRRTFIASGLAAASQARLLAQRLGLRLGFDTYTLRAFDWKAPRLLDYAAEMKLDTIQFALGNFDSLEPQYLQKVKDQAARLGIVIDGGMGCICPTSSGWRPEERSPTAYLLKGLRATHAIGATCMRVYMGGPAERRGAIPLEKHIETTIQALRSVRSQALDFNVKIAVENHGDFQAWELREMIEVAGKEFVGVCLDSGNPVAAMEDPLVTIETLGPYTVTTHIRDSAVYEHARGSAWQWVALGDGSIDLPRFFRRFKELCPNAGVQLEILTGTAPRLLPYLDTDFWKAFPRARASEFARFVALAKKGQPFMGSMVIAPTSQKLAEYDAALRQQQRFDLERSFDYAAKTLGVGLRRNT